MAEVREGEVAAEQMRRKPDSSGGGQVPDNEQNNDLSCLVLLTGKVLFCLIVSVLSATAPVSECREATPGGAAQAARRSGSKMSQTSKQRKRPAKACRAGLPLKGAVCGSRLGLKKRAGAASAGARGYARHKDSAEWLD